MKGKLRLIACLLALVAGLTACGGQAYTVPETQPAGAYVAKVTGLPVPPLAVEDPQDVADLMNALANADLQAVTESTQLPENAAFRFTLTDAAGKEIDTYAVYASEYVQIGQSLYRGDLTELHQWLATLFTAKQLTELSDLFTQPADGVAEIALHNNEAGAFKVVTTPEEIQVVWTVLGTVTLTQTQTDPAADAVTAFTLYARMDEQTGYAAPLTFLRSQEAWWVRCGDKTCAIQPIDWQTTYDWLPANAMPIPAE